jgi:hypothetical protein
VLSDRKLWACAAELHRRHQNPAPIFIAERLGALVLAGDAAGAAVWKSIIFRFQQLRMLTSLPS